MSAKPEKKPTGTGETKRSRPSRKEVLDARKGMLALRKELEGKRKKLEGQTKQLRKLARTQDMPVWVDEAANLYTKENYSYMDMLKHLRKNKIL